MASFDIKSELNSHELTNAVDQANRVLKARFDFKGTGAEFTLSDKEISLSTKEDFQIKQMEPVLHESLSKRGIDLRTLKPGDIEVSNGSARQQILQGIAEVFRSIICIKTGHWPARMVVAEETEQILMRTSQDEDQKDVI